MADNDDDDDFPMDDVPMADGRWLKGDPALKPPQLTLPTVMLEAAMSNKVLRRFQLEASLAVVVRAPSADWVEPLSRAAGKLATWNAKLAGLRNARGKSLDTTVSDQVVDALGRGFRAVGVSHHPDVLLPSALVAAADLTIEVVAPTNAIIGKAIELATGSLPRRMPKDIAAGLDFATICTAIRIGSSPSECVRRLVNAGKIRFGGDAALASVPGLEALHGYGDAMTWAQRLIGDLESWRRGELDFASLERGVVLASAPGLGKTTFVRSLAKTARLPLFASSVGSWFGNSTGNLDGVIKQVDKLFQAAAAVAPAIVFLDEIEAIPNRATMDPRNEDYWTPIIGHMLTTLDSAGSSVASKLIVIGATNYPEKLDAALVRPGRLNRIIQIRSPSSADLVGILRQHLGRDLPGADLTGIADAGIGASGAVAEGWVKSARAAARFARRPLEIGDLVAQVLPVSEFSASIQRRIAVHEAGHAVVMQALGLSAVQSVSIVSHGGSGGRTSVDIPDALMTLEDIENIILFILAGRSAEELMIGSASTGAGGGQHSDLGKATAMLAMAHTSMGLGESLVYRSIPDRALELVSLDPRLAAEVDRDLRRLHTRCTELVSRHRLTIERVAAALLEEQVLSGGRFLEIVEQPTKPQTKIVSRSRRIGGRSNG